MAATEAKQSGGGNMSASDESAKDSAAGWPKPVIGGNTTQPHVADAPRQKPKRPRKDPRAIERANLTNVAKLIIKELIDSSMAHGRMLDDDHVPLQQFFVVLEHILNHGLKPKKGILRDKREFWCVLESIEKYEPGASEITTSVKEMPNVKSPTGRARAWLRLSLMQKTLADHFKLLIEKKDEILSEFYEPGALMTEDEGAVIAGLLVGLNVIDCNFCIKEEDLDQPIGVIDFSLYLKSKGPGQPEEMEHTETNSTQMATILDQKNYLEELNRHLNATVANLQQKLEQVQATNALMKEDLARANNDILMLQEENGILQRERDSLLAEHQRQLEATKQDIDAERQTYQTSRAGLDNLYSEAKKKLDDEIQLRLDVERELELQIGMKTEMEMAMKLLEKDIHEKQDTIVSLRQQIDNIKAINLEMYNKLQTCEGSLKHKTEMVTKLEEKTTQLVGALKEMEKKCKKMESDKTAAEETARKLGQNIAERDAKKAALETDLRIEREWRGTLQRQLEQEKEHTSQMAMELQQMKEIKLEYHDLMERHQVLQSTCEEQEAALRELGSHLSESKLKMEDMREAQLASREAQWVQDGEANTCKQCHKEFSISRRKHHCRSCGEIFCNECSDNKMPLPSNSKKVRVCDNCHTALLQRYSAT